MVISAKPKPCGIWSGSGSYINHGASAPWREHDMMKVALDRIAEVLQKLVIETACRSYQGRRGSVKDNAHRRELEVPEGWSMREIDRDAGWC